MRKILLMLSLAAFFSLAFGEDLDSGVTKLTANLAAAVNKSGAKKLSVIDFTDLQGNTNELGRYIAEQLSVALVAAAKDYSVMDRANMKTILEEHKLTATGLINPENARELGRFAGVDTIVLGNMTIFEDTISLTVKAISTETTQIIGADTVRISKSKDIVMLLQHLEQSASTSAKVSTNGSSSVPEKAKATLQERGSYSIELLWLRPRPDGTFVCAFEITNKTQSETLGFAINQLSNAGKGGLSGKLVDSDGVVTRLYMTDGLPVMKTLDGGRTGVEFVIDEMQKYRDYKWVPTMVDVAAGSKIRFTTEYENRNGWRELEKRDSAGNPPYTVELGLVVASKATKTPTPRLDAILFDRISGSH